MCDHDQTAMSVKKLHSCYTTFSSDRPSSQAVCKSAGNLYCYSSRTETDGFTRSKETSAEASHEYYKKYENDEVPVKDDSSFNDHSFSEDNELRSGDNKDSLTNSDLDKLEMKILSKISRELQTDDDVDSLDSNIKLFRTTVQEIFNNFYNHMNDFELYKKKFHEILEKNKGDSFSEMEDFIRDMIQNIESSKSLISCEKGIKSPPIENKLWDKSSEECKINANDINPKLSKSVNSTMETYLNENYLTDSTFDEGSSKFNTDFKRENPLNIYHIKGNPCVEIKKKNCDMHSEINIRENNREGRIEKQIASAENIKKLAAKKLQIDNYAKLQEARIKDREIPVKISSAKKNIHLDEDFSCEGKEESKFFIFKICNYICRKLAGIRSVNAN